MSKQVPFLKNGSGWKIFAQFSANNYLMCLLEKDSVRYAPLCIHSFHLIAPRKLLEAQLFNQQYYRYEELTNISDRLRWCRHRLGLMQKEVAELIGITQAHYRNYEVGHVDYCPKEIVDKLAVLFGISAKDLLDDYNLFLYRGQGEMIKKCRESFGMERKEFAKMIHVNARLLGAWELKRKRISINSWNRYFKDIVKW